ncbi:MAG: DUF222 domain-containing protein [Dermatophilus congolensis]|nr:DUF222 domain-containing protein [Dermatophilus congolensis]
MSIAESPVRWDEYPETITAAPLPGASQGSGYADSEVDDWAEAAAYATRYYRAPIGASAPDAAQVTELRTSATAPAAATAVAVAVADSDRVVAPGPGSADAATTRRARLAGSISAHPRVRLSNDDFYAHQADVLQQVREVAGVLNRAHAELVTLVADALTTGVWAEAGIKSPAHWLTLRVGLSAGRANSVLEIAKRHHALTATMGLFSDGDLSMEQVGVIARNVPDHYEAEVLNLARHATVPQIQRATRHYTWAPAPTATASDAEKPDEGATTATGHDVEDSAQPEPAAATPKSAVNPFDPTNAAPSLSMRYTPNGRFVLHLDAPAHLGALVESAVREAKDALFHAITRGNTNGNPSAQAEPVLGVFGKPATADAANTIRRTPPGTLPTLADGLIEVARRSLDTVTAGSRRDNYRIYLHLDMRDGSVDHPGTNAWLNGHELLPAHLVQRLTCDGIIQPLWEKEGVPVSVGRAMRIVPTRTRRLIHDRDRGCRFPGCASTAHVDIHHIQHWADGGRTDTPDLVSLCPFHHDAHHRGEFTMRGNADLPETDPRALRFYTHADFPLTFEPPPAPEPDSPSANPDRTRYDGPSGDTLHTHWVDFEPTPRSAWSWS